MIDPREAAPDIERIIMRRLYEKRIEGYTLEMSQEIARALLAVPSPSGEVQLREALERFVKDFKSSARRSSDGILIASICEDVLEIATAALAAASSSPSPPDGETP